MTKALAFFFDAGSGVCLWAKNDEARSVYDYAVDHAGLPVDEATRAELDRLIAWHDGALDMNDPGRGCIWTEEESARFDSAAQSLLQRLRTQLAPPEWRIIDERRANGR